jgi:hypothetical protein
MGRVIGLDKIGTLSHSGGIITMNPSLLTIGGQQYRTTSAITRTIATDITMAANTRYQIFAIVSGGVVSLKISANENSVGPAGSTSWKLVGSFYANGAASVAFGSFVNIEGMPVSDQITFDAVFSFTAVTSKTSYWWRRGKWFFAHYKFHGNGAQPATSQNMSKPTNITFDETNTSTGTDTVSDYPAGSWAGEDAGVQSYGGGVFYRNSDDVFYNATQAGAASNSNPYSFSTGDYWKTIIRDMPVLGWSNTPIKDL